MSTEVYFGVSDDPMFIVKVVYNDTEGEPGEALYGPFDIEEAAIEFMDNWTCDRTDISDSWVEPLNLVTREEVQA